MGWTAYYQLLRDRPLDEAEAVKLCDFIRKTNRKPWDGESFGLRLSRDARPDHVLAHGAQKFPRADESDDQERLLGVLTELSKLIEDVEVRVEDDFNVFGWDDDANEAAMDGPTTELVSIKDYDSFESPEKLLGPRPEPLPTAVDELLAGAKPHRKMVASALVEYANMPAEDPRREALENVLRATPALMRVQAALYTFGLLTGSTEALQIVAAAQPSTDEVASIVEDFLVQWEKPRGVYWFELLLSSLGKTTLDALARIPKIEKKMRGDLRKAVDEDAPDLTYRCARAAATMLGRSRSRQALYVLIQTARDLRPHKEWRDPGPRYSVMPDVIAALKKFEGPEIIPTLSIIEPPGPADESIENTLLGKEWLVLEALRTELGIAAPPSLSSLFGPDLPKQPVEPLPFPKDPPPLSLPVDDLDHLISAVGNEQVPSMALLDRVGLSREEKMGAWERDQVVAEHLRKLPPDQLTARLIAKLPEAHKASVMRDLCAAVFPQTIDQAGVAERLLALWESAFTTPWEWSSRATDCLLSVVSHPVIFRRMIDEIAAPDDASVRGRTSSALELLANAHARRSEAVSALVARLRRDRGRPRDIVPWRHEAMRALRKLESEDGVPTAILELADIAGVHRASESFELLARFSSGTGALQQAVDLRECAPDAVRALCKSPHVGEESRHKYASHPFWKVRLMAAEKNPNAEQARQLMRDVWAAVDTEGLPVAADDDRYLRPDGNKRAPANPTAPRTLPLPRDGMASSCFDYRAWSIWAVDELRNPEDAVARVLADELDMAMVERGHMRVAPRWQRWRDVISDLPIDRSGRLAWARAQLDAPMPPLLARVRDEGARTVAAELPAPHLVLPPELRKELEERERQVAEVGETLFTA